jgi:hypothetical protein
MSPAHLFAAGRDEILGYGGEVIEADAHQTPGYTLRG